MTDRHATCFYLNNLGSNWVCVKCGYHLVVDADEHYEILAVGDPKAEHYADLGKIVDLPLPPPTDDKTANELTVAECVDMGNRLLWWLVNLPEELAEML